METFAEKMNPERVHFINAALHYDERRNQVALEAFLRRIQKLRMRRFCVLVSSVMTPLLLKDFREISKFFEDLGLSLIPKVIRGWFQGKIYPGAYSPEEKSLIREYLEKARQSYASLTAAMGETPTIDMFADDRLLDNPRLYHGKLCGSGHNFVRIEPHGAVVRCGSGMQLGNILLKSVSLLNGPKPCDSLYCPYFCEKYTSPPFVPAQTTQREIDDFLVSVKTWRDSRRQQAGG
jgi:MoaA/NifB/PqqE/SkfB family radical SAM enzyme